MYNGKIVCMKKLGSVILSFVLCGCAAVGTKTLYRANYTPNIHKIGYCDIYYSESVASVCPQINDIFHTTIREIIEKYGMPDSLKVGSIIKEDKKNISEYCEKNNLDALLFTNLRFIRGNIMHGGANYDAEVEMRLYNSQGVLLFSTLHNTYKGNSYFWPPSANTTARDGIKGAFKGLAKEMRLKH